MEFSAEWKWNKAQDLKMEWYLRLLDPDQRYQRQFQSATRDRPKEIIRNRNRILPLQNFQEELQDLQEGGLQDQELQQQDQFLEELQEQELKELLQDLDFQEQDQLLCRLKEFGSRSKLKEIFIFVERLDLFF